MRRLISSWAAPGQPVNCSTALSTLYSDKMGRRRTGNVSSDEISSDIPGSSAGSTELRRGGRSAANLRASFCRLRGTLEEERRREIYGKAISHEWQLRSSFTREGDGAWGQLSGQSKGFRGRWVVKRGHKKVLNIS